MNTDFMKGVVVHIITVIDKDEKIDLVAGRDLPAARLEPLRGRADRDLWVQALS